MTTETTERPTTHDGILRWVEEIADLTEAWQRAAHATPHGKPILLENVVVPRHSVRSILVNEHRPEELDVGLLVETRAGRAAEGGMLYPGA